MKTVTKNVYTKKIQKSPQNLIQKQELKLKSDLQKIEQYWDTKFNAL